MTGAWGMARAARAAGVCLLLTAVIAAPAPGASPTELRVALEAGGTLTWELRVMQWLALDRRYGVQAQPVKFATKAAAETALWGGAVDVKVDDWLFATRARTQGFRVQAVDAFSRAVGGIVVAKDGPVRTIGDLRGRRIGVSGAADKSYLALRAVAVSQFGFDPQKESQVLQVAPPLLSQLLERGEVDAIVQYWQFIPGLVATGRFRELTSAVTLLRRLVPGVELPFLVVVATDDAVRSKRDALRGFLTALREAKNQLAVHTDLWDGLYGEDLLALTDRTLETGLIARYRVGLPGPWDRAAIAGLATLTARLVSVAGPEVVGVEKLDPAAYNVDLVAKR